MISSLTSWPLGHNERRRRFRSARRVFGILHRAKAQGLLRDVKKVRRDGWQSRFVDVGVIVVIDHDGVHYELRVINSTILAVVKRFSGTPMVLVGDGESSEETLAKLVKIIPPIKGVRLRRKAPNKTRLN
ncbi:MAG: hypothetical protein HYW37_00250 [Candidatus Colwellbacteria bacterium]|nr:hypothetical protein [Candidatus Colwellbacteria bacterium]